MYRLRASVTSILFENVLLSSATNKRSYTSHSPLCKTCVMFSPRIHLALRFDSSRFLKKLHGYLTSPQSVEVMSLQFHTTANPFPLDSLSLYCFSKSPNPISVNMLQITSNKMYWKEMTWKEIIFKNRTQMQSFWLKSRVQKIRWAMIPLLSSPTCFTSSMLFWMLYLLQIDKGRVLQWTEVWEENRRKFIILITFNILIKPVVFN